MPFSNGRSTGKPRRVTEAAPFSVREHSRTPAHPTHEAFGSRGYTWLMRRQFHMPSILVIVYVVVGLIVAQQHHYFSNLGTIKRIVSAVLAVLLWWLLLLGINLHIK